MIRRRRKRKRKRKKRRRRNKWKFACTGNKAQEEAITQQNHKRASDHTALDTTTLLREHDVIPRVAAETTTSPIAVNLLRARRRVSPGRLLL